MLRNCALGGNGPHVGLVLVHAKVGVALVDFAPTATDPVGRLRHALDARRFPAIFGGYPPMARAVLSTDRLRNLDDVLVAEFKAQPPLALAGGDAWVRTARAAIEANMPVAVPESLRVRQRGAFAWRRTALTVVVLGSVATMAMVLALPGNGPRNAPDATNLAVTELGVARERLPGVALKGESLAATDSVVAPPNEAEADITAPGTVARLGSGALGEAPSASDGLAASRPGRTAAAAAPDVAANPLEPNSPAELPPAPTVPIDAGTFQPRHGPPATSAPGAPVAVEEPRPVPRRAAGPAVVPPQPPSQVLATGSRPAPLPSTGAPIAEMGDRGRCRGILMRVTTGEALADDDKEYLRRGCRPRR